jgi:hypothetical protein
MTTKGYNLFSEAQPRKGEGLTSASSLWLYHDVLSDRAVGFPNYREAKKIARTDVAYWSDLLLFEKVNGSSSAFSTAQTRIEPDVWEQQRLGAASSNSLNTDYYGIVIDAIPRGFDNITLSYYVRRFFDTITVNYSVFEPYVPSESDVWNSTEYLSALMRFKTALDDLSVLTVIAKPNYWVMTPVKTDLDLGHPLAGLRQFGIVESGSGDSRYWVFYTRAIDRPWNLIDAKFKELIFSGADTLWKMTLIGVCQMICGLDSGHTSETIAFSRRIDWVKDVGARYK